MKCQKCSLENRSGAHFCKQCGQALPDTDQALQDAPSAGTTCPSCDAANDADARFCRKCGRTLAPSSGITCPACDAANDSDARFCRQCGQALPEQATEPPPAPESVSVHIEGNVSGQVAIGNNILQIGDVLGGVVNVMMPEQKVEPKPRPTPIDLRPRPFPDLLDRETELSAATMALQSVQPVEFHGQAGLGKTALLRHLAHHPTADAFPDGVVYLSARRQPVDDLLQSLYDAFYETDIPYKPTDAQLKHDLQDKRALIMLDDVDMTREDMEAMMNTASTCSFLLASPERRLWGEGESLALGGLPPDDALALMERELGRPLTPEERPTAQLLCDTTQGHPLRLIQAAAEAREEGRTLVEALEREDVVTPSPFAALDALPASEQQVLAVLAALGGAPVHTDHLPALTALPDVTPALQALQRRGLAQVHSPRYTLTGALDQALGQAWDLTPWMERALAHFIDWAEGLQDPEQLLEDADAILQTLEWAVGEGRWADVLRLGRAIEGALALGGRWAVWAQTLRWTLQAGQALGDQAAEAWSLHQLGTRSLCLGENTAAQISLAQALRLREALGNQAGATITKHNLSLLLSVPPTPPTPKPRPPLPKWLLPVVGVVAVTAIAVAVGVGGGIPRGAPTLTMTPTAIPTPTATVTPTPRPTSTPTPIPTPWVSIELEDGCDRVYNYGDETRLFARANVESDIRVWLDDKTPIGRIKLSPGEAKYRDWTFEDIPPGEHVLTASLTQPDEVDVLAEASCPFTIVDVEGPEAPNLLEPEEDILCPSRGPITVTLRWSRVDDPAGINLYEVEVARFPDDPPAPVTSTLQIKGDQSQTSISGLCGDGYEWRVRAVDNEENEGEWSKWGNFRIFTLIESDTEGPFAPAPLRPGTLYESSPEVILCSQVVLQWKAALDRAGGSGVQDYRIELQRYDGTWLNIPLYSFITDTSYDVTDRLYRSSTRYRWRVFARDRAGNIGDVSDRLYFECAYTPTPTSTPTSTPPPTPTPTPTPAPTSTPTPTLTPTYSWTPRPFTPPPPTPKLWGPF